ncbi:hypothetical protein DVH05_023780 [Phytophthora capsici]|nr:hypothetical protein DVH05_023780 [Phytophthora capsici]
MSPIHTKSPGTVAFNPLVMAAARRRRKETVNERVEHILRGALRDAEEEALEEREGGPETRGRALQRSHQLASLYTTSTDSKFLRSRAKRDASLQLLKETKDVEPPADSEHSGSVIGEGHESEESDDDTASIGKAVVTPPIKPIPMVISPVKLVKPWYGSTTATLHQQMPPGTTLDAKLRRYGARGTAKLQGWRSQEILEPLPMSPVAPANDYLTGLSGSPSLWPPETFHPTGSRLPVTMTRCPSSPIAVSVVIKDPNQVEQCQIFTDTHGNLQQEAAQKLQKVYKEEILSAKREKLQNQREMTEWQSRSLHFEPSSELVAHREQKKSDPQLRYRRTKVSAIVQTPGYSPEKQRNKESSELYKTRFKLRWRALTRLLDAMRRTPCRRPVLQDMEKLFALARELGALNALGTCHLSRSQFTQLITREFPLCDLKHVNRLFSSYDWEIRDLVDTRILLGTLRALRVQQGEPVELICASLRDLNALDSNGKDDDTVAMGGSLVKALSLCCSSDKEEKQMETRALDIWTKVLSWQRQILSRRLHGGPVHNVWKLKPGASSVVSGFSHVTNTDEEVLKTEDSEDAEDCKEEISDLMRLVDESRVPVRRIRVALKRERETLELFTQQLLQRRHDCLVGASECSPRTN